MYKVYIETKNYEPFFIAVVDESNSILAVLLSVIQKEYKGVVGRLSARSIIWGGPLIKDNSPKVLDFLLRAYLKEIKHKAVYTQFRNIFEWDSELIKKFMKCGFNYEDHLDIIHDLTISPEEQMMKMHQGRRKNIRRAMKKEVVFGKIESKNEFSQALKLINQTYKKIKLPLPDDSIFWSAFGILYPKNMVEFFKATYAGEIIGVRFVLCFKNLIYDWYAGSSSQYLDKYPNDFLPWKVMEWGNINGFSKFDFGGAGNPNKEYGVREYKLKFGGQLVNWGRFEKINNPFLMNLAKIGFYFWRIINLW